MPLGFMIFAYHANKFENMKLSCEWFYFVSFFFWQYFGFFFCCIYFLFVHKRLKINMKCLTDKPTPNDLGRRLTGWLVGCLAGRTNNSFGRIAQTDITIFLLLSFGGHISHVLM